MVMDNLLSYQVNNLLSDKRTVGSCVNTIEELSVEVYSKIRLGYANKKAASGLMDFDDMQSYLYLWLVKFGSSEDENERNTAAGIRSYCRAMWRDFYIDEAQDVSKIQFEILKSMMTEPDAPNKLLVNLVVIGDDDQCIYEWRGSNPSILLSIGPTFNIRTLVLSTNYRCKRNVLDYASNGIKYNTTRYEKGMKSYMDGGEVEIIKSKKMDLYSLSGIARDCVKKFMSGGSKENEIAVLSRNNFHLWILSNMLLRDGIYCYMTDDMKLTKSYMYRDIKSLFDLSEPSWKSTLTSSMLWKICNYMSKAASSLIGNFQDSTGLSLCDTLGYLLKKFTNRGINFDTAGKKIVIPKQTEQQLDYYMSRLQSVTIDDLEDIYNALNTGDSKKAFEILTFKYLETSSYMYKSKDKKRTIQGIIKYITYLIEEDGVEKTKSLLRVTEQFENSRMGIVGDRVTLSTIHSAKGREWKNVIMFACDNISQPSFDGICSMVDKGVSVSDIFKNIDEERRLFYVGNTRAKDKLTVITYEEPSIFMKEALGEVDNSNNDDRILRLAQGVE